MRCLLVAVLIPILALGTFGGTQFLAHSHDEHGLHLHAVGQLKGDRLAAAIHADHHGQDRAVQPSDWTDPCDDGECREGLDDEPEGVIVSIDVHKQRPTRGTDLAASLLPAVMLTIAVFEMSPSLDLDHCIGSPGGALGGGPLDLVALSASDRLIRTSRALLI